MKAPFLEMERMMRQYQSCESAECDEGESSGWLHRPLGTPVVLSPVHSHIETMVRWQ